MAENSKPAQPKFYEVVFRGKPKVVRAFMNGLLLGSDSKSTVYYSFLEGVFHEGKAEKLKEMVGIRGVDCHIIVDASTSTLLKKLKKQISAETGLEITAHRTIRSASLFFEFNAYAPRYNREIVQLVKSAPPGVRLVGFKHEEKLDPSAKGVEAYATAHEYEACGEATLTGPVNLVIEMKRKFMDYPLIKSDDVVLKLA